MLQTFQSDDIPQEFKGRLILVAEDNLVSQTVLLYWLTLADIQTCVATTGLEVIAYVNSEPQPPDLILMDMQMPELDGVEAARKMRALGFQFPIVGVSADATDVEKNACEMAGMNDFLAKPIDFDELWGCLTRWLSPSHHNQKALDHESVERRFLNSDGPLLRARAAFIDGHCADADRLNTLIAQQDWVGLTRLTHGLKGAAGCLGLDALVSQAVVLESLVQSQAPATHLYDVCRQIARELAQLSTSLI